MNDFTKEELETLLYLFECAKTSSYWVCREGYHDNLELKIKIKLDDHCEHHWILHAASEGKMVVFCNKCNRCKE